MRVERFKKLWSHSYYKNSVAKLSMEDIQEVMDFIEKNQTKDRNDFVHAVNRMFIGKDKPKKWTLISEILTVIG